MAIRFAMTLSEYLHSEGITPSRFAVSIKVPPSTISRILKGDRSPRSYIMRRIAEVTGGAVMPNDFAGIPAQPTKTAAE